MEIALVVQAVQVTGTTAFQAGMYHLAIPVAAQTCLAVGNLTPCVCLLATALQMLMEHPAARTWTATLNTATQAYAAHKFKHVAQIQTAPKIRAVMVLPSHVGTVWQLAFLRAVHYGPPQAIRVWVVSITSRSGATVPAPALIAVIKLMPAGWQIA